MDTQICCQVVKVGLHATPWMSRWYLIFTEDGTLKPWVWPHKGIWSYSCMYKQHKIMYKYVTNKMLYKKKLSDLAICTMFANPGPEQDKVSQQVTSVFTPSTLESCRSDNNLTLLASSREHERNELGVKNIPTVLPKLSWSLMGPQEQRHNSSPLEWCTHEAKNISERKRET